jgi:hypothetical protein
MIGKMTSFADSKGDKALFDLLLPLNLNELDPILQQLEANLYKGETHKINKKAIITKSYPELWVIFCIMDCSCYPFRIKSIILFSNF